MPAYWPGRVSVGHCLARMVTGFARSMTPEGYWTVADNDTDVELCQNLSTGVTLLESCASDRQLFLDPLMAYRSRPVQLNWRLIVGPIRMSLAAFESVTKLQ